MDHGRTIFLQVDQPRQAGVEYADLPPGLVESRGIGIGFVPGEGVVAELVPMARELMDLMVSDAVNGAIKSGQKIACRKGCHAECCRFLVSVSVPEAIAMASETAMLAANERRRIVDSCRTFAEQIQYRMSRDDFAANGSVGRNDLTSWYYKQGLPCPFLEEDCCSIYEWRPIVCRECIVVGSPDVCKSGGGVRTELSMPVHLANVLVRLTGELFSSDGESVVLSGVFDWFASHGQAYKKVWSREFLVRRFIALATEQHCRITAGKVLS